jgi:predicted nucleic acid-binding protein
VISYVDISAAMKLLVEEPESAALVTYLQEDRGDADLVASWLLHTELHCAANRHPEDVDRAAVGVVLDTLTLVDVTRGDLISAGALQGRLRSNDAVHLAAALRISAEELITYDAELAAAAQQAGLSVAGPA